MRLIIAEKPSVGRDIAKVLGRAEDKDGYIIAQGDDVITWAKGHLIGLARPEDYAEWQGSWNLEALPMIPKEFKLLISKTKHVRDQYKVIEKLLKSADEVVIATDAAREGELIARWILEKANYKGPTKRLWITSLTEKAIREGFESLRPGKDFNNLAKAAKERSIADWLVGMNTSRAYTVKAGQTLSLGRVQTPTLAMIVNRENEINNFVSKPFYELLAEYEKDGQKFVGKYKLEDESRFSNRKILDNVLEEVKNSENRVFLVEEKEVRKRPPLFFDLTALQKVMNDKHSWTAQKTLDIAQKLYEAKFITYPRTDSKYLTKELVEDLKDKLNPSGRDLSTDKRYVDESKITDHHAIIPTGQVSNGISDDEGLLFEVIRNYSLAAFSNDGIDAETRVEIKAGEYLFEAKGKVVLDLGWRSIIEEEKEDTNVLPSLEEGELLEPPILGVKEGKTSPPKRYTESGILTAMENAGRDLEDEDKEILKEVGGIGTPATRAGTIETLKKREFVVIQGKTFRPTDKAFALIEALGGSPLVSPQITAEWEQELKDIEEGNLEPRVFREKIELFVSGLVDEAKTSDIKIKEKEVESLGPCPVCGKGLREYHGENGRYACSDHFVLWKKKGGKQLAAAQLKKLLTAGKTDLIKGFTSKDGKKFNAYLVLDSTGKVSYKFK